MGGHRYSVLFALLLHFTSAQMNERTDESSGSAGSQGDESNSKKQFPLGPARNGVQRVVFDEVPNISNNIDFPDEPLAPGSIDAYDDSFVDIKEEEPLFIPQPYRPTTKPPKTIRPTTASRPLIVTRPPLPPQTPPPEVPSQFLSQQFTPPSGVPQGPIARPLPQPRPQPQPQRPQIPQQPFIPRPPIRPRPQPPHTVPRVGLPPRRPQAENLRTGVCRQSIFYISAPMRTTTVVAFTHFAITVSVDQCARTCHEFNCAIAHYDPASGKCQFTPSTAFAIRPGQCPRWPIHHYRNNIVTNQPLRIFCVQCHKPLRRGRGRTQEGITFQNRNLNQFGRGAPRAKARAVKRHDFNNSEKASFLQPTVIANTSTGVPSISGTLFQQPKWISLGPSRLSDIGKLDAVDRKPPDTLSSFEAKMVSMENSKPSVKQASVEDKIEMNGSIVTSENTIPEIEVTA